MAKKSLKKRIDDLVDALGAGKKPTLPEIRSELVSLGAIAQELEDGQALSEKEAAIAALEAENKNLKVELQTANAELEAFRVERKKQKERERQKDLPEIQFRILQRLPTENVGGYWLTIFQVGRSLKIPHDEVEIHLAQLESAGLVMRQKDGSGQLVWHRSIKGSQLVLAKRLAGEEEPQNTGEQPDLSKMEATVLRAVAKQDGMTAAEIVERVNKSIPTIGKPLFNLPLVVLFLVKLRQKNLVADDGGAGTDCRWVVSPDGIDYLVKRGLLPN